MTDPLTVRQNPDIKYLGKLLGDVIRSYGGDELYRRTEYIRSTSVDRHRGVADADAIDPGLDALTLDETLAFVRGFMLFSLLANLAEDRQGVSAEQGASVVEAVELLANEGVDKDAILQLLDDALIAPVLTAHPTEVRRKSMIDHKAHIAELLLMKDAGDSETPQGDNLDEAIMRQIAPAVADPPLATRAAVCHRRSANFAKLYEGRIPACPAAPLCQVGEGAGRTIAQFPEAQ